jgi:hypothetical protein
MFSMLSPTHFDGSDVIVIDSNGQRVPAVDEVQLEPGLARIFVNKAARTWLRTMLRAPDESLACAIHSRTGELHHCGAVRVVCV